ncbi:unnamed protein product [Soboliphyme baturini]|uniref:G_PROTEIN_RECEP_F1_2 domain-containing protein n=1 Tax=Soboliphyme baturini TaxID=241478 RepID=A0A183J7E6_9BILA|nr:unnamed protein product [Soboliphyme baturini]
MCGLATSNSNSTNTTSYYGGVSGWRQNAYAVAVPIFISICVLVMVSNLLVLVTLRWVKTKPTSTLRFTVSLAISDVWTSTIVAVSLVYNSYITVVYRLSISACVALTFEGIHTGGLLTGTLHLLALSVNHYIVVSQPFLHHKILSTRNTLTVIVLLWVIPPVALLLCFASIENQGFRSPDGKCTDVDFFHKLEFRLTISIIILLFIVMMSLLYIAVLVFLNKEAKKFLIKQHCSNSQRIRRMRNTLVTTLIIWGTFVVGWIPTSLIFVLTCSTCLFPYSQTSAYNVVFFISILANLCILLKSLVNPIVYAIRIPEIRTVMTRLLQRWGSGSKKRQRKCALQSCRPRNRRSPDEMILK